MPRHCRFVTSLPFRHVTAVSSRHCRFVTSLPFLHVAAVSARRCIRPQRLLLGDAVAFERHERFS